MIKSHICLQFMKSHEWISESLTFNMLIIAPVFFLFVCLLLFFCSLGALHSGVGVSVISTPKRTMPLHFKLASLTLSPNLWYIHSNYVNPVHSKSNLSIFSSASCLFVEPALSRSSKQVSQPSCRTIISLLLLPFFHKSPLKSCLHSLLHCSFSPSITLFQSLDFWLLFTSVSCSFPVTPVSLSFI